jgi:poly(A) polymerase/tRNA nucleotidyltransferase (CCA-adding enzyme)
VRLGDIRYPHKYIRREPDGKGGMRYIYFESEEKMITEQDKSKEARKYPFAIELAKETQQILNVLKANGHEAFIVGGAVRDVLMGKAPKDYDIVTSAKPQQIQKLFKIEGSVGAKFAVNIVDGHEVASYRIDDEEATSAKETEVSLASSADEDVRRRDFTVNALLYDPETKQVFDFVGGLSDIKSNTLRFVGDPEKRIKQDPMRMLRAIRFANNKGLNLDINTFKAIQKNMHLIKKEAPERISAEMMRMFEAKSVINGLYLMLTTGFIREIIPELYEGFNVEQNRHHAESILMHNILAADAIKKDDPLLKLALLLHDVGKVKTKEFNEETQDYNFLGHETVGADMAKKIMTRLKFSSEQIDRVFNIIKGHMFYFTDESKDKTIKKFMSLPEFRSILRARMADRKANLAKKDRSAVPYSFKKLLKRIRVIQTTKQPISVKDLAISGNDLIGLGLKPGPLFGKILNNALELVLEQPEHNKKEILLEFAKKEFKT